MLTEFNNKLISFCSLIELEKHEHNLVLFDILVTHAQKEGRRSYYEIGYDDVPNSKFIRVWEQTALNGGGKSVCYFVERSTGNIYGSEGWKKPNFKRQYGTLDTINEWDWSEYYAVSKKGVDTLVPIGMRRK